MRPGGPRQGQGGGDRRRQITEDSRAAGEDLGPAAGCCRRREIGTSAWRQQQQMLFHSTDAEDLGVRPSEAEDVARFVGRKKQRSFFTNAKLQLFSYAKIICRSL